MQLRWSSNIKVVAADLPTLTFGRSKGLGFDRVVIKLSTGVYHRPKQIAFGKAPAEDDALVEAFLKDE